MQFQYNTLVVGHSEIEIKHYGVDGFWEIQMLGYFLLKIVVIPKIL